MYDPCVKTPHIGRCDAATNLAIDDELIATAKELGGHKTKKEAVTVALEEYIRQKRLEGLLLMEGKVDYRDDYDYKEVRRRDGLQA